MRELVKLFNVKRKELTSNQICRMYTGIKKDWVNEEQHKHIFFVKTYLKKKIF